MLVDECHVTRVNQGLFTTTMEAEKRDPGNEVGALPWPPNKVFLQIICQSGCANLIDSHASLQSSDAWIM